MKIVTFQKPEILAEIEAKGYAACHVPECAVNDHEFTRAYDWLVGKMKERIGLPKHSGIEYPLWGWYRRGCRKKPIKYYSGDFNTPRAVMTLEIPDSELVLSDFDLWNCVLNGYNVYGSSAEAKKLSRDRYKFIDENGHCDLDDYPEDLRQRIIKSWDNVFDLDTRLKFYPMKQNREIQATFWELRKEWIRDVKICDPIPEIYYPDSFDDDDFDDDDDYDADDE